MSRPDVPRMIGRMPSGWPRVTVYYAAMAIWLPFFIVLRIIRLGHPLYLTETAVVQLHEHGRSVYIKDMFARIVTLQEVFDNIGVSPAAGQVFLSVMGQPEKQEEVRDFRILLRADDIVTVLPEELPHAFGGRTKQRRGNE